MSLAGDTKQTEPMTLENAKELVFWGHTVFVGHHVCWYGYSALLKQHLLIPLEA
jgi:hypothetical protein